jgi:uncharacterized protein YjbJ (UPF0337 family)
MLSAGMPIEEFREHFSHPRVYMHTNHGERTMDKDRIKGSAEQAKGSMKEAAGKAMGDSKLQAEGKADKMKGKIQNAAGGAKDAMKGR